MLLLLFIILLALFLFSASLLSALCIWILTFWSLCHFRIVNADMHFLIWSMSSDCSLFRRIDGSYRLTVIFEANTTEAKAKGAIIFPISFIESNCNSCGLRSVSNIYMCCSLCSTSNVNSRKQGVFHAALQTSLLQLLFNTLFDIFLLLEPSLLKIVVLPLETLFVLCEGTVHYTIEVLLHFLDVFFSSSEPFEEDVKLFI